MEETKELNSEETVVVRMRAEDRDKLKAKAKKLGVSMVEYFSILAAPVTMAEEKEGIPVEIVPLEDGDPCKVTNEVPAKKAVTDEFEVTSNRLANDPDKIDKKTGKFITYFKD